MYFYLIYSSIIIILILLFILFKTDLFLRPSEGFKDKFNYRLGDVVDDEKVNNDAKMKYIYTVLYNKSIADEYYRKSGKIKDYETLYKIIKKRMKGKDLAPKNTLIIHIRIGDVIDWINPRSINDILGDENPTSYYISYEYLNKKIKKMKDINDSVKNIILVGGYHTKGDHSRSEEYIDKIKKFLILNNFNVETRVDNGINKADEDILWMSQSQYFIKSGGRFSNVVSKIIELNGGIVI